ncbi:MAG TPA: GNAT family N-acetyltransferase [Herpetosiphonaceae bacterium]|nr:GNAT family N-acetyltransferase [Herpetosiphonaceae bacterium]
MTTTIRQISAAEARPLRAAVLRPGQSPERQRYPGDDDPQTLHAGAFVGAGLAGVATLALDPPPGADDPRAWRLRGMAVAPAHQGRGLGRRLIEACVEHARRRGGSQIWCLGRTGAAPFYRSLGFALLGAEFDLPESGPHYVMRLLLPSPSLE